MARGETVDEKAWRYLLDGHLTIGLIANGKILASCKGSGGRSYVLGFDQGRWLCSCPALGACCHLRALLLVTNSPKENA